MRALTKKQKKLIDQWMGENSELCNLGFSVETCREFDEVYEKLQEINDTEILWSECNRYVSDNCFNLDKREPWLR